MLLRTALFLTCLSVGVSAPVQVQYPFVNIAHAKHDQQLNKAQDFVQKVAEEGIGFLRNADLTQEQRVQSFETFLSKHFDMRSIGRFALGTYWRLASKAQRSEYLDLFEVNVLRLYSGRFSEYKDQHVEVRKARKEGKLDTVVTSYVVAPGQPDIKLDWRLRKRNGQYKIIDVIVAGVSMAMTQRADYSSVIQRGGGKVEVLLKHLRP